MPRSSVGQKRKAKNAGVGIDFKRARHKVGKKLPKAQNETNTTFKSKAITLPTQTVGDTKGAAVTQKNLTLKELLGQSGHYSPKVRLEALQGLSELLAAHPEALRSQVGPLLEKVGDRVSDSDRDVRSALKRLLAQIVLPQIQGGLLNPFLPLLMAHVCSAMTHLDNAVRADSLAFLEMLMAAAPDRISAEYFEPAVAMFSNLLSPTARSRKISSKSQQELLAVLLSLEKFLSQASSEEKRGISALDASTSAETDGELGSRLPLYSSSKEKLSHLALNRKLMRAVRALDNPDSDGDSEDAKLRKSLIELAGHLLAAFSESCTSLTEGSEASLALSAIRAALQSLTLILERLELGNPSEEVDRLFTVVLKKIGPHIPMSVPSVHRSRSNLSAIMLLNLSGMQLFTVMLKRESLQPAGGEELAWVHGLLDYFEAVLYRGEVVAPDFDSVEEMVQPLIPANVYKALFRGIRQVLPSVSATRRRQLIGGVMALCMRSSSKSASKAACLAFMADILSKPIQFTGSGPSAAPPVAEEELVGLLQGLPKLLWELGPARSETSHLALRLLFDAGRFSRPGGLVAAALGALQPSLALFFCTLRPPKAATPSQPGRTQELGEHSANLLSPFSKLPPHTQDLATSLVYYLPSLDLVLLRSLRMLCQSSLVSASLTSRIVSVLSAKLSAECRQPVLLDLLMDILERREDPLLPGDIPLCLDLAREMAELNSESLCVLEHLEDRLTAACQNSGISPCIGCLALVAQVAELQRERQALLWRQRQEVFQNREEAIANAANRAGPSKEAEQPDDSQPGIQAVAACQSGLSSQAAERISDAVPAALLAALPEGLCSAVVSCTDSSAQSSKDPAFAERSQTAMKAVTRLLVALPGLLKSFLRRIPQACRAPGQAAKGRAGETANRLEAAALVLLGLCDNKPVLQLLADCRSDLLAASQSLRALAEEVSGESAAGQASLTACQTLSATVSRLTGSANQALEESPRQA